ncbi:hypothetical protein RT717_11190 [Imperialibacter roseus]|uniref:Protein NO VEIN C-terminal domain-containing protein n=1 Tax=Imperialibacter roseus TaxID=1324217 RepID=A0ABZ0IZT1_9BACT|nr:hypothetical protein [Imperialibacter roseus]WOK09201.1 hypothetical protein RT717_11190 [Imperialibacter roseus]
MKLEALHKSHIEQAAAIIDAHGIPKNYVWSQYYVVVNGKEYPFKHLIRTAYELATEEQLQFQSNESYRGYVENHLGFEFQYYEGGYNFFTKEELDFYESIYHEDYRKSNKDQEHYGRKLYPINAKLKYWLEQVKLVGFKIRYDGRWLGTNTKVVDYLWPRIYKGEDNDIFFNAEVAAYDRFIGFKLDGYHATTKKLSDSKLEILKQFKDDPKNSWRWWKISFDEIHNYNWERLIKETKEYIEEQIANHDYLKEILSKESKIARITWNTNGWIKPSGLTGKSTNPSFENEHGFGHEEWLFDGDKVIEGYKYGFLEPIHKYRSKYEGQIFDLTLYTRDAESNKSFWVTNLKDVEVLLPEESEKILAHYRKEGWYDEMKADLYNLNLDSRQLDTWIKEGAEQLFNVKFKAAQLNEIPAELIPVLNDNEIASNRYTLMDLPSDLQEKIKDSVKTGFSFEDTGSEEADLGTKSKRTGRKREIELELKHNILQTKFLKYLQKKYGKAIVKRECMAYGASRIDVTRKTDTGYIFYEIKTYNSLRTSIREGIGQLLEYSLYPNVNEAQCIVLVSHVAPSGEVRNYLNHLKNFIKLPFSYIHFDIEQEEIISEI